MALMFHQRPSQVLSIDDDYVAYCVDEAGAWLLSQKEPPRYGQKDQALNGNDKLLKAVAAIGGARIEME